MARFFEIVDRFLAAIGKWFQSPILLILRLFFGISFIMAGLSKLQDIPKFTDSLISLNVPSPEILAWAVGLTEFIGGALLTVGLLSRLAALGLICVMVGAYATAHVDAVHVFTSNPKLFVSQAPFNFLLTALLVFAFGPGIFSIDALLFSDRSKKVPK